VRRGVRRAQRRAHQHPQRLPAPGLGHPRRHDRGGDPEVAVGVVLPGVAAQATSARGGGVDQRGRDSYLLGVSTRRMEKLVSTLGIDRLSKSQVSAMARDLDAQVEAFRTRPLDAGPYTFVAADALVLKVREGGRTVNVHALLATGVNAEGYKEILGLHVTSAEDGAGQSRSHGRHDQGSNTDPIGNTRNTCVTECVPEPAFADVQVSFA
jgi:putative transposase